MKEKTHIFPLHFQVPGRPQSAALPRLPCRVDAAVSRPPLHPAGRRRRLPAQPAKVPGDRGEGAWKEDAFPLLSRQ